MSQTPTPNVPLDEPTTAPTAGEPLNGIEPGLPAGIDPPDTGDDEFPFESSEFGVGGFLPHLDADAPADGGTAES